MTRADLMQANLDGIDAHAEISKRATEDIDYAISVGIVNKKDRDRAIDRLRGKRILAVLTLLQRGA